MTSREPLGCSAPAAPIGVDALFNKYAWLVARSSWKVLHYVEGVTFETWHDWWEHAEWWPRTAACGRSFEATLPGIFSRMGAPRCKGCCRSLGIADGNGAPLNDHQFDALREAIGATGVERPTTEDEA